jgi:hypothetical protein
MENWFPINYVLLANNLTDTSLISNIWVKPANLHYTIIKTNLSGYAYGFIIYNNLLVIEGL